MNVFKYRQGNKDDIDALFNNYFYSPLPKDLNDPFETFVEEEFYKEELKNFIISKGKQHSKNVREHYEKVVASVDDILERFNKKTGFYSLSRNNLNEMMWSLYANSHKGFCLEYDLNGLLSPGSEPYKYRYKIEVQYLDKQPVLRMEDVAKIKNDNGQAIFVKKGGTKSLLWSHEQEIRIVTDKIGQNTYEKNALKAIYFGVRMEDEKKQMIVKNFKKSNVKFFQMELDRKSYKLLFKPYKNSF